MSTRCQIEFRSGSTRRTVYRHWDGYPSAVIPDLLAFLAWSTRRADIEYEPANFLYWSKRGTGKQEQVGFGICANDELHADIEYYYVVRYEGGTCTISAHEVEHNGGEVRVGRVVAVAPASFSSSFSNILRGMLDCSVSMARAGGVAKTALPCLMVSHVGGAWHVLPFHEVPAAQSEVAELVASSSSLLYRKKIRLL